MKKVLFLIFFIFYVSSFCDDGYININYKGLDNVHLSFYGQVYLHRGKLILKVVETEEILFQQEFGENGGYVSQNIHHTGLSEGTYTYQLWSYWIDDEGNIISTQLLASSSVDINGKIYGELLYDETINDTAFLEGDITIPENKQLTLNGNLVGLSEYPNYQRKNVYVKGDIEFGRDVAINELNIHFQSKSVNIEKLGGNGNLIFYSNSSGSTVNKCTGFLGITIKNNTSLTITNSEIGGIEMEETNTSLNIENSVVKGWTNLRKINNFTANKSVFLGYLAIYGGKPNFIECEFANTIYLYGRSEGEFKNCVFGSSLCFSDSFDLDGILKWSDNSSIQPEFSNNSFVGATGPYIDEETNVASKINLGTNYYGDKKPTFLWEYIFTYSGEKAKEIGLGDGVWLPDMFLTRGIIIDEYSCFEVNSWNSSGPKMSYQKVLPSIWLNDYVVGQNILLHFKDAFGFKKKVLIKGRETLLSLDVATNFESVSGVKFKAIFDGQEIQPINPTVVLHRDLSDYKKDIFYGNTTVNFILPPTDKDSVELEVIMDTTEIVGFDGVEGKGETKILGTYLQFENSYGRKLNILVQPVVLTGLLGGAITNVPAATRVVNSLKKLIPAMLPISKDDIHIWTSRPLKFYSGVLSIFGSNSLSTVELLNRIATELALGKGFFNTVASISSSPINIDFVVAVLPHGVLGEGVTGANLVLRRGIIFIDENYPDAALHEMGHGIGLWTGTEQYDYYPPAGIPIEGLTAFINEPSTANSLNGFKNRFLHFPHKGQSWYEENYWYDIMGATSNLIWPTWLTFSSFKSYFQSTLGEKTELKQLQYLKGPSGYRRIFVVGEAEIVRTWWDYYYRIIPGTVKAFDITDIATSKIDMPVEMNYEPDDDYKLECYDPTGNLITTIYFTSKSPYPQDIPSDKLPDKIIIFGTIDIPENTNSYKIYHRVWWDVWEENPIFEVNFTEYEEIEIKSPVQGTTLSDIVEISWTKEDTNISQNVNYIIMASDDGGNRWFPITLPIEKSKMTISTDFLKSSNNIIFKVIGSNGLGSISDEVTGLKIENRKPKAIIQTPKNGWVGEAGTKWELKGYGEDIEDGIIQRGIWTSSIDGEINTETDIILSQEHHILTFEVEDSGGLKDSASVEIEVKEIEEVDIGIREGDLSIIRSKDPLNTSPIDWLKKDEIHRVILRIQNTGKETSFTGSIYLTTPGETERLLVSKNFVASPFEEVVISETFIASSEGEYIIKGEIKDITPEDTNTTNNTMIWKYMTKPKLPVIGIFPDELDFGNTRSKKEGYILVKNYGDANLRITGLTITGTDSREFSVDTNILEQDILPDNSIFIPVYFSPDTEGEKNAILTINSNDSSNSSISINVKGNCIGLIGDINGGGIDISDVILCLRQAIGIDTPEIDKADINEDGVIDIIDVILILRKAIGLPI